MMLGIMNPMNKSARTLRREKKDVFNRAFAALYDLDTASVRFPDEIRREIAQGKRIVRRAQLKWIFSYRAAIHTFPNPKTEVIEKE